MQPLCFGGSFNPIHVGHLTCAKAVATGQRFGKVVLIPAFVSPFKISNGADLASPEDRLAMCRLAASSEAAAGLFEVDDVETRRGGPSYTLDTVRSLKTRGGDWKDLAWLIGADQLMGLPRWHRPVELMAECRLVVMARPGWTMDWDTLPPAFRHLRHHVAEAPLVDVSATEVRRRVRAGEPITRLVPEAVERYIRDRGLYR
jgi:nicotinate-nucleotide adenylyltransferase